MAEGNRTLKIVGITCGVLLLLGACGVGGCFLFCGGSVAGVWQATKAPANVTKGFFADVRAGHPADAHGRLSPEYRERLPLERFRERIDELPALRDHSDDTMNQRHVRTGGATMGGHLTTAQGPVPVEAQLGQRADRWYIESLTVGGEAL